MVDDILQRDFVLFLDASFGDQPGTILRTTVSPEPGSGGFNEPSLRRRCSPPPNSFSATLHWPCALALAGWSFDLGQKMSQIANRRMPDSIRLARGRRVPSPQAASSILHGNEIATRLAVIRTRAERSARNGSSSPNCHYRAPGFSESQTARSLLVGVMRREESVFQTRAQKADPSASSTPASAKPALVGDPVSFVMTNAIRMPLLSAKLHHLLEVGPRHGLCNG